MKETRFRLLFEAWLNDRLTPAEEPEWWALLADPDLDILRKDLTDAAYEELPVRFTMDPVSAELLYKRIRRPDQKQKGRVVQMPRIRAAVAIVLLLVAASGGWWWWHQRGAAPVAQTQAPIPQGDLPPGGNRAMLTLGNGKTITLDSAADGLVAEQGLTRVQKTGNGRLAYVPGEGKAEVKYNTLTTPRGGQYRLTLPDGTRVWLNAASSITYPTAFTGAERRVRMTGEAYFEVVHQAQKPFRVEAGKALLEDLGTAFNVNAYADEPAMTTTLIQGALSVDTLRLVPGQQADREPDGRLRLVRDADVAQALAWKNGAFAFAGADVRAVMRQLSRWYDVDVDYAGTPPPGVFTGKIGRGLTLTQVLNGLATTRIHYRLVDAHHMQILPQ